METTASQGPQRVDPQHQDHHLVEVTIDGQKKEVRPGDYLVSDFKNIVGVAADKILDEVIDGKFVELKDSDRVKIKGGEKFVSHGHGGGSA